jgi:hypothetical protein
LDFDDVRAYDRGVVFARLFLLLLMTAALLEAREPTAPVWLVSNGLHTSAGLRVQDLPMAREILDDRRADLALIGWGAHDYYRAHINPWSIAKAIFGHSGSLLHVVPIHGRIQNRFSHSDIVRLDLPRSAVREFVREIESSFARDERGQLRYFGRGYYGDSRFYNGSERFYLANNCNVRLAARLRRAGVPMCLPCSVIAPGLIAQAAKHGTRESRRSQPGDGY